MPSKDKTPHETLRVKIWWRYIGTEFVPVRVTDDLEKWTGSTLHAGIKITSHTVVRPTFTEQERKEYEYSNPG